MPSDEVVEDFCTIFDSSFLVLGLAMRRSLRRHCPGARLWVLGMDETVVAQLRALGLNGIEVIPVADVETPDLLAAKATRSRGEYCWTLSPVFPEWLLATGRAGRRVTYVDADLYFFGSPQRIFQELEDSGKDVLITEHAYDPAYDQTKTSGRFCVQFMTFNATSGARRVLAWWREKCVAWCFARFEDGRFGDQKYLDVWPDIFAEEVHVLRNRFLALAPWNVEFATGKANPARIAPVLFHFHGLRFFDERAVRSFVGYRVSRRSQAAYYAPYLEELAWIAAEWPLPSRAALPLVSRGGWGAKTRRFVMRALGREAVHRLGPGLSRS